MNRGEVDHIAELRGIETLPLLFILNALLRRRSHTSANCKNRDGIPIRAQLFSAKRLLDLIYRDHKEGMETRVVMRRQSKINVRDRICQKP